MEPDSDENEQTELDFQQQAQWLAGRRIHRRKPKRVNQVISQLMARKGFNQVESLQQIQSIWESLLGGRLKGMSLATGIRGGKLIVVVKNAVVNQELSFNKSDLLQKIKNSPIGNRVTDIRFRIGVF